MAKYVCYNEILSYKVFLSYSSLLLGKIELCYTSTEDFVIQRFIISRFQCIIMESMLDDC